MFFFIVLAIGLGLYNYSSNLSFHPHTAASVISLVDNQRQLYSDIHSSCYVCVTLSSNTKELIHFAAITVRYFLFLGRPITD